MGVLHLFAHFLFHCPQLWWLRGARWSWLRPEEDVAAGLNCLILKIVLIEIISRFLSSVAPPHSAGNLAQSGLWQGQRFVGFYYHWCCLFLILRLSLSSTRSSQATLAEHYLLVGQTEDLASMYQVLELVGFNTLIYWYILYILSWWVLI